MWRCSTCHLVFRYPRLSKEKLDELYRQGTSVNWPDEPEGRIDWALAAEFISSYPNVQRVLDIGCFDGRFLDHLDSKYQKLGVEIHVEAARRAEALKIRIIARDYDELDLHRDIADAVVATDVLEHTEDPLKFLEGLSQTVNPGGLIIVATGNTNSASWRLMGSRYWYCHIAEHISFINPKWAARAARQLDLEVVDTRYYSHVAPPVRLRQRVYEMIANLLLRFFPGLFSVLRRSGAGGIDLQRYPDLSLTPPYWMSAQDHMLTVFRKNS